MEPDSDFGHEFSNKWVAYFDLLGFTKLLERYTWLPECVLEVFKDATKALENSADIWVHSGQIDYCWFSDTFLIWTTDDSEKAFVCLEQASRLFFVRLLSKRIPVRGAIDFGPFYGKKQESTYIGTALLKAYRHAENQEWINYVLTGPTVKRLSDLNLIDSYLWEYSETSHFEGQIFKSGFLPHDGFLAYRYSPNDSTCDHVRRYLKRLQEEANGQSDIPPRVAKKYEISMKWLDMQTETQPVLEAFEK